jgi:acyl dehydratase
MDSVGAQFWLTFRKLNLDKPNDMLVSQDKHLAYAEFSGDMSPIHISEAFAIKAGFNGLVVHGSHLIEIAMIKFFEEIPAAVLIHLKVDFIHSICVNEEFLVEMNLSEKSGEICITVKNAIRARINMVYNRTEMPSSGFGKLASHDFYKDISKVSRYIGMIDPGESAVFRQLEVFSGQPPPVKFLGENVKRKDHYFDNYTIRTTALVNRLVNLDEAIINVARDVRHELGESELGKKTFLIVGFGTLGKVIYQVLSGLGYSDGFIFTSKPRDAEEFLKRSSFSSSTKIQVLKNDAELPSSADIIFYTASPKIEMETKENFERLKQLYRKVYYEDLLSLLEVVKHEKLFYPSTSYIDNVPEDFAQYVSVKLKTELKLQKLYNPLKSRYLLLRLPPFTSRHHSILMKSQKEVGIKDLSNLLTLELKKWLLH